MGFSFVFVWHWLLNIVIFGMLRGNGVAINMSDEKLYVDMMSQDQHV